MELMIKIDATIEVKDGMDLQGALEAIEQAIQILQGEGKAAGSAVLIPSAKETKLQFTW